jgi:hypothetical protein
MQAPAAKLSRIARGWKHRLRRCSARRRKKAQPSFSRKQAPIVFQIASQAHVLIRSRRIDRTRLIGRRGHWRRADTPFFNSRWTTSNTGRSTKAQPMMAYWHDSAVEPGQENGLFELWPAAPVIRNARRYRRKPELNGKAETASGR